MRVPVGQVGMALAGCCRPSSGSAMQSLTRACGAEEEGGVKSKLTQSAQYYDWPAGGGQFNVKASLRDKFTREGI